jgi:uncharacterized membrane protein YozB (DUF420 family)
MYPHLLATHSGLRWLVLLSILYAIFRAWQGQRTGRAYSKGDNLARVLAASFSHLQLLVGFVLYFASPTVQLFLQNSTQALRNSQLLFFGILHLALMLVAVVVLTIGSSLAKRAKVDAQKFRLIMVYFSIALFIILIAVPWPFSPLAGRPWIRGF